MLLKITHQTDLEYTDLINETVMELRMTPRQEQDQHRLSFALAIGPPTSIASYFDWQGNTVHAFSINSFHKQIRIVATCVLETNREALNLNELPDEWPVRWEGDYTVWDYLRYGGAVVDCPELRKLTEELGPKPGMKLGPLVLRTLKLINDRFTYQKGVTTAASPITEILSQGSGVCQDFTHLMIGLARAMGIPARYVSGFLHPDMERYRGYAQTHAWCELYFPSTGWVGVDPTNNSVVNAHFVKVAVGRDYRDVPPHKGLFKGSVTESMDVKVLSEDLPRVPMGLPAERLETLSVPMYASVREYARDNGGQQEVQQQQQQRKEDGEYHQQQQQQQQQ